MFAVIRFDFNGCQSADLAEGRTQLLEMASGRLTVLILDHFVVKLGEIDVDATELGRGDGGEMGLGCGGNVERCERSEPRARHLCERRAGVIGWGDGVGQSKAYQRGERAKMSKRIVREGGADIYLDKVVECA